MMAFRILLCLVSAACARFAWLGAKGFWYDELHTLEFTDTVYDSLGGLKFILTSGRPMYFLLSAPFLAMGIDPAWAVRVVAAAAGVAGLGFVLLAGRAFGDRSAALAALAIGVLHPYHLFLSREARYYSLLFALVAAAAWAHHRHRESPTSGRAAILIFVLVLGLHTHLLFAGVLIALALLDGVRLLRAREGRDRLWREAGTVYGLVLLFNVPLNRFGAMNVLQALVGSGGADTNVTVSSGFGAGVPDHFVNPWSACSPDLWLRTAGLFLGDSIPGAIGGTGLFLAGVVAAWRGSPPLLACAIAVTLCTWLPLAATQPTHPVVPRYLVAALPFVLLLQGWGAASLWKSAPHGRRVGAALIALTACGQSLAGVDYLRRDHQGWREFVERVESGPHARDPIWFYREWQTKVYRHHSRFPDRELHVLELGRGRAGLAIAADRLRRAADHGPIWFFNVTYLPPPGSEEFLEEVARHPGLGDLDTLFLYRTRGR